jgi:hypothetical protein
MKYAQKLIEIKHKFVFKLAYLLLRGT